MIAHKKLAGDLQDGRSIVADAQGSKKSWLLRTVMDRLALSAINVLPGRNTTGKHPAKRAIARCYEADAGRLILAWLSSVLVLMSGDLQCLKHR